jgi:hypothetical protein
MRDAWVRSPFSNILTLHGEPCLEPREGFTCRFPRFPLRRLRVFESSTLAPRVGEFGFAIAPIKGILFLFFLFFFCFFPVLVWKCERRRRVPRGWDEKCPGAYVGDLEEMCPVSGLHPFAGFSSAHPTTTTFLGRGGRFRKSGTSSGFGGKHQKRKQIMLCTYFQSRPFDKLQFGTEAACAFSILQYIL